MVRGRLLLVAGLGVAAALLPAAIPASAAIDPGEYTTVVRDITVPDSSPAGAVVRSHAARANASSPAARSGMTPPAIQIHS